MGFKGGLFGIHTCCIHYRPSIWMIQSITSAVRDFTQPDIFGTEFTCTAAGFTRTLLGQSDSAKVNPNNSLELPDRYLAGFWVCNKSPGRYLAGFWGRLLTGCQCLQVDYTDKKSHPRRSKNALGLVRIEPLRIW